MKLILCVLITLYSSLGLHAQGIQFFQGSFEEAQNKADQENKLLFIDFYTVWCVPCKVLDRDVFSQKIVGDEFNKQFIAFKLDAEKEGKVLAKRFNVNAYPTLVFVGRDSTLVHKLVGSVGADKLLTEAGIALAMQDDPNSYARLKSQYSTHKNDPVFLKNYISKMVSFSESPVTAIEDYLAVQTSIKENSADMMEFFLAYAKDMRCGGKAEEILEANYATYMDIATKKESRVLETLPAKLMQNTYRQAMATASVPLYEIFLDRWLKMPEKPYYADYNAYRLELISLQKDDKLYKIEAEKYLDSLTQAQTVAEIKERDAQRYETFIKENPVTIGFFAEAKKQAQQDLDAGILVRNLNKVLANYLPLISKKKDFKRVEHWIDYGRALLPADIALANIEVKMLLQQGDYKQALAKKQQLLQDVDPMHRDYEVLRAELEQMTKDSK